jgi:hypothetical protein
MTCSKPARITANSGQPSIDMQLYDRQRVHPSLLRILRFHAVAMIGLHPSVLLLSEPGRSFRFTQASRY